MSNQINTLNSSLLISQTKNWIDNSKMSKFNEIFSCKKELDILSEFLFIISNLYSTQGNLEISNFYLNVANFLNPKFTFNLKVFIH